MGRAEAARDSRKTGLWPIWLMMGMGNIRAITAGHASVGSCSPYTKQRDCHSGVGEVIRSRSARAKNGFNSTEDNSYGSMTCRNALEILTPREQLQKYPKYKNHPCEVS